MFSLQYLFMCNETSAIQNKICTKGKRLLNSVWFILKKFLPFNIFHIFSYFTLVDKFTNPFYLGHCWVEGDNKSNSVDSNYYGPISKVFICWLLSPGLRIRIRRNYYNMDPAPVAKATHIMGKSNFCLQKYCIYKYTNQTKFK